MQLFSHIAIILAVSGVVAAMIVLPDTHNALSWFAAVGVLITAFLAVRHALRMEFAKPPRTTLRQVHRNK